MTLAFTQLGFIGIQFSDGSATYLVLMLMPVALAACLLGTLAGLGMGFFAGVILYLHAILMPLDYYELTFITPMTSIAMMSVCGALLGMLFALVLRRERALRWRILLVVVVCFVVSACFSGGFLALVSMQETGRLNEAQSQVDQALISANNIGFQAISDAVLMALVSCIGLICAEHRLRKMDNVGLRPAFNAWLSVVVTSAFMIVAIAAYGAITAGALATEGEDMHDDTEYLLGQIDRTAEFNGIIMSALGDAGADLGKAVDSWPAGGLLASVLAGLSEERDGLVLVSLTESDLLIGTNVDRMKDVENLADCLDADTLAAAERSVANGTIERVIYDGPSAANDLVELSLPGMGTLSSDSLTHQIGYLSAVKNEGYQVTVIRPASMVFSDRNDVMGWVSLSSLALLLAVFALTWRLLDLMVGRRIDSTNAALARITEGDLKTRVASDGTSEFKALSAGINSTVSALQGWIAEAESRMDAELATAKAIQESALPQTFPPYPDILHFDIYASMNAAKEVGGDFYDLFLIGDADADSGKLGFVMADVSGKGVPAALFMMKAKTQIRDYLEAGMELGEAIENANRQLVDGNDAGMFVTAWVGVLDYASNHIEFVNAGHNPPLLWQFGSDDADEPGAKGSWRWLTEKSGMPLGLFDGFPYKTFSLECKSGDTLLLYTDGVTEAMNTDGELYGEDRLEKLVNADATLHPRELVLAVRMDVAEHSFGAEQSDDITILALEVGVPPEEKAVLVVPAETDKLERVNEFIHTELDRRLCPVRVQNQLDIAVEELFVNVCKYAYKDASEDVPRIVRVTQAISADPPSVTVEIIDGGTPFDPLAKPDAAKADEYEDVDNIPIGGLGIFMAKSSVDEMRYERIDESNVITLVKRW